jgi:peptidoglycan/LPS O-acetylase OafA/YrhL
MGLASWTKRLDDRVVGAAEKDPAVRRRGERWARSVLVLSVLVLLLADYIGSRKTHLPLAVPWVIAGMLLGFLVLWIRTRERRRPDSE